MDGCVEVIMVLAMLRDGSIFLHLRGRLSLCQYHGFFYQPPNHGGVIGKVIGRPVSVCVCKCVRWGWRGWGRGGAIK